MRAGRLTLAALLINAALVVAVFVCASAASGEVSEPPGSLFVVNSASGKLVKTPGPSRGLRLVLTDLSSEVTLFTDRPQRVVKRSNPRTLARHWRSLGFESVPPNAALVIANPRRKHRSVLIITLEKPQILQGGRAMAFHAEVLKGSPSEALEGFAQRAGRRVAKHFGKTSLFIDPSGLPSGLQYTVKGVSGNGFSVRLSNTTWDPIGSTVTTTGTSQLITTPDSFRVLPRRLTAGAATAIDADISMFAVPGFGGTITGQTEMPPGATGTVTVSYKDPAGFDRFYMRTIPPGFRPFTYPVVGTDLH
jgi:hypothetical protein